MEEQYTESLQKQGEVVADLAIRITTLEKLLIQKNIITEQDYLGILSSVRDELINMVMKQIKDAEVQKNGKDK